MKSTVNIKWSFIKRERFSVVSLTRFLSETISLVWFVFCCCCCCCCYCVISVVVVFVVTIRMMSSSNTFQTSWSCYSSVNSKLSRWSCGSSSSSSLGDGTSDAVDANIELNSTNLHLRSPIVFFFNIYIYFYTCLWNPLAPVPVCIRLYEHLLWETREL